MNLEKDCKHLALWRAFISLVLGKYNQRTMENNPNRSQITNAGMVDVGEILASMISLNDIGIDVRSIKF